MASGCGKSNHFGKQYLEHENFDFYLDEGVMFSTDYYLTNNSPHDLEDVSIVITATGVSGESKTLEQYWGRWLKGQQRRATAAFSDDETAYKIEKISIEGASDKYYFDFGIRYATDN